MGEASDRVEQQNANTIESKADIKNSDKLLASGKHSIMGKEIEIKEAVPKERGRDVEDYGEEKPTMPPPPPSTTTTVKTTKPVK